VKFKRFCCFLRLVYTINKHSERRDYDVRWFHASSRLSKNIDDKSANNLRSFTSSVFSLTRHRTFRFFCCHRLGKNTVAKEGEKLSKKHSYDPRGKSSFILKIHSRPFGSIFCYIRGNMHLCYKLFVRVRKGYYYRMFGFLLEKRSGS